MSIITISTNDATSRAALRRVLFFLESFLVFFIAPFSYQMYLLSDSFYSQAATHPLFSQSYFVRVPFYGLPRFITLN